jgi:signal transduction histidine kinase
MKPFQNNPKKQYDFRQIFLDFNRSLQVIKDRSLLISSIVTRIRELIPAGDIHVFWENGNETGFELINTSQGAPCGLRLLPGDGLARWLRLNETPQVVSFAPEFAGIFSANDEMVVKSLETAVIYSLKTNNRFRGIVMMTKRKDGLPYSRSDLEMLAVMLDNAALAVENIVYHEERANHLKHIFRADRMAVIGQLAAGAAHEIRNPLTSIRSAIQYVQDDIRDAGKRNMMNAVLQEVDRINGILAGLLSFSRQNSPVKREFDLAVLAGETVDFVSRTRIGKQIALNVSCFAPSAPVVADREQMKQVLMNVILNAMDAIEGEGRVDVDIRQAVAEGGTFYAVTVSDTGSGIDEASLEKVFDPFYTTRDDGTGLGLSISYGIVHRHGGSIDIGNRPESGAQVVIRLPKGTDGTGASHGS